MLTLADLQLITDSKNGDIYAVKEENRNYIWNGTEWVEYSDNTPATTDELVKEVIDIIQKGHIYGVKRNIESSDPAWERIGDSVGMVANATHDGTEVQNDFDNIYPYSDIITYNYDVQAQRITAYYGEPTFKFDGSNGEVLTRIPEFWYKREQKLEEDGNTYEYIYIADYPAENFIKSEQFSVGRYIASSDSNNHLHSLSNSSVCTDTIINLRNSAKALGQGFCLMDWHYFIIQLLYLVEYANYDSQTTLGKGLKTSNSVNSGLCDSLGMKSGTLNDDGNCSVSFRGIENIYGRCTTFIDGIYTSTDGIYVYYNNENLDGNLSESENKLNNNFENMSRDYAKKIGYDENNPIIQLPIEAGASNSTYICDVTAFSFAGDEKSIICNSYMVNDIETMGLWSFRTMAFSKTSRTRLLLNK